MLHHKKKHRIKIQMWYRFYIIGIKKYNKIFFEEIILLAVWRCMCTWLKDTRTSKQYLQNAGGVNDNSPLHAWASNSHAFDQAYNNEHFWALCFRTTLDSTESRLEFMCQEWLHFENSVHDLPPEETELIIAAVGQAQLLLKIKLTQFHDLISIHWHILIGRWNRKTCHNFKSSSMLGHGTDAGAAHYD